MTDLVALWLDDLAAEVDRPVPPAPAAGESATNRAALANRLRAATKKFVVAFGLP